MSALGWLLLVLMAAALTASLAFNWWQSSQLDQVHGTHAGSRPRGVFPAARPGTTLLSPAEAAAHADAMHEISAPYLPGSHAQAWPPLTERTVPVAQTGDSAPWDIPTGSFPVLSQAEQDERAAFVRSQLPERAEDATRGDMELALALLRERTAADLPLAPMYEPTNEQTRELYSSGTGLEYQQACTADVLAIEAAGQAAMLP